ncbi:MAG: hypothetical protein L6Q71_09610 [Planctomycetes bacterium]|nr:hypothetical protein [Planctomycetota bacterium]NUQ35401.1 hypothetical protein [Planctomycetaceae bacterium]
MKRLYKIIGWDADYESEVCPGVVELCYEQLNYAAHDELTEAAGKGIVFYGSHGAGGDYPAGVFASNGKRFMVCNAVDNCAAPVAAIESDGEPCCQELKDALIYWRLRKRAEAWMGITPKRKAG